MESAPGNSSVDALLGEPERLASSGLVAGLGSDECLARQGLHLTSDCLVASPVSLVLTIALDLRSDVGHKKGTR